MHPKCDIISLNIYFLRFGTIRSRTRNDDYDFRPAEEYYEAPVEYDIDNGNSQSFGPEYNIMTSAVNVSS